MHKCSKCRQTKSLSEFNMRTGSRAGKPLAWCKACHQIYSAKKHQDYKRAGNRAHKKYIQKCRDFIKQAKSIPCTDCAVQYPHYMMQFDHLRDKQYTISQMYTRVGLPTIKKEIAKCEVVCANCHAERTYGP